MSAKRWPLGTCKRERCWLCPTRRRWPTRLRDTGHLPLLRSVPRRTMRAAYHGFTVSPRCPALTGEWFRSLHTSTFFLGLHCAEVADAGFMPISFYLRFKKLKLSRKCFVITLKCVIYCTPANIITFSYPVYGNIRVF